MIASSGRDMADRARMFYRNAALIRLPDKWYMLGVQSEVVGYPISTPLTTDSYGFSQCFVDVSFTQSLSKEIEMVQMTDQVSGVQTIPNYFNEVISPAEFRDGTTLSIAYAANCTKLFRFFLQDSSGIEH